MVLFCTYCTSFVLNSGRVVTTTTILSSPMDWVRSRGPERNHTLESLSPPGSSKDVSFSFPGSGSPHFPSLMRQQNGIYINLIFCTSCNQLTLWKEGKKKRRTRLTFHPSIHFRREFLTPRTLETSPDKTLRHPVRTAQYKVPGIVRKMHHHWRQGLFRFEQGSKDMRLVRRMERRRS